MDFFSQQQSIMSNQYIIQVRLWNNLLGILFWDETKNEIIFEFNKNYKNKAITTTKSKSC